MDIDTIDSREKKISCYCPFNSSAILLPTTKTMKTTRAQKSLATVPLRSQSIFGENGQVRNTDIFTIIEHANLGTFLLIN